MERFIIYTANPLTDLEKTIKKLRTLPGVVDVETSVDFRPQPPEDMQILIEFVADGGTDAVANIQRQLDEWWPLLRRENLDRGPGESELAKFVGSPWYKDYRVAKPLDDKNLPRYEFISDKSADGLAFSTTAKYLLQQQDIHVTHWIDQTQNGESALKGAFQVVAGDGRSLVRVAETLVGWELQEAKIWPEAKAGQPKV